MNSQRWISQNLDDSTRGKNKSYFSVFLMQDLDAALPIIEKYKDHLVAIGEVMIQYC